MSRFFLVDTASVDRLSSASDKESYSSNGTIECHIQPMDAEASVLSGGAVGQSYKLYTETGVDLQVTDKITINSVVYIVKAEQDFTNFTPSAFPHKEWVVERKKDG